MSTPAMSDTAPVLRLDTTLPDDPAAHARVLQPLLAQAAGPGAQPVSLTLDYGVAAGAGEPVTAEAWVERATRTLVFAHARVLTRSGDMAATGSAVFRREAPASAPAQGQG